MTIDEFFEWVEENKEKIFEMSFGDYWIQLPFGLIGDIVKRTYVYAQEEIKNGSC